MDVLVDLGSEWGQYEYVTNIGFVACPTARCAWLAFRWRGPPLFRVGDWMHSCEAVRGLEGGRRMSWLVH